jgi:hypothetical protein
MPNDQDLRELQEEKDVRARVMNAGIVAAAVAAFMMVGVAMWYDGWFSNELGVAAVPSNPAASTSATAPPASSGTVGQAPQNPAPAQNTR